MEQLTVTFRVDSAIQKEYIGVPSTTSDESTYEPQFYLLRDDLHGEIICCVRGTQSLADMCVLSLAQLLASTLIYSRPPSQPHRPRSRSRTRQTPFAQPRPRRRRRRRVFRSCWYPRRRSSSTRSSRQSTLRQTQDGPRRASRLLSRARRTFVGRQHCFERCFPSRRIPQ